MLPSRHVIPLCHTIAQSVTSFCLSSAARLVDGGVAVVATALPGVAGAVVAAVAVAAVAGGTAGVGVGRTRMYSSRSMKSTQREVRRERYAQSLMAMTWKEDTAQQISKGRGRGKTGTGDSDRR